MSEKKGLHFPPETRETNGVEQIPLTESFQFSQENGSENLKILTLINNNKVK